jgi:D-beta-D-heptose 7-phosphate kinase/D-beta-D-heptose 1-phosphate adenosyltransferase
MEKIVLVTGGFDPLHSGHLAYLKAAKKLGDKLIVGINSDDWRKGRRHEILSAIRYVDGCILFNDQDDTAIEAIKNVRMLFPFAQIIFANGGDRTSDNIPEMVFEDVKFVFGVGGEDKKNSSSWILKKYEQG